ncbi:MAG: PaaI family thioesterase [Bdellovibrionaceae bacterium]|nr:PaaI family thioesterase [Pseudobdellovibrionaceae bacterium]
MQDTTKSFVSQLIEKVPKPLRSTVIMRAFGFLKVPLLFACSPRVLELNEKTCRVEIPFNRKVKNHLGSVYFGALAIGADTCIGMLAMDQIYTSKKNVSLVFKDFKANFLKRAVGPTVFVCEQGQQVSELLEETIRSGERQHRTILAFAQVNGETVAEFELTLSLKLLK